MTSYDLFIQLTKVENLGAYVKYFKRFFTENYAFRKPKRNIALLHLPKKETCYIIGLGPSLKGVDLNKIRGDTIVVNRFYKFGEKWPNFIPNYYVIYDKAFLKPELNEEFTDILDAYKDASTRYILNYAYSKSPYLEALPENKVYFISAFKGLFNHKKEYKIDKVMPAFRNVIGASIGFAMGLGYKKIVLLGCDFNSFAFRTSEHAYADGGARTITMSLELFSYAEVALHHMELQQYAQEHGIEIINSTKGSLIDAYTYNIDEELYKK